MTPNIKVTIGIPTKNSERTIKYCLGSIINANIDKAKIEIIIVDGGSTDQTLEQANKMLRNSNIKYKFFYDEGKGVAYARQIIVEEAQGDYIAWIDSDNIASRDFFKYGLNILEKDPEVGLTYPTYIPLGSKRLIERLQRYYARILPKIGLSTSPPFTASSWPSWLQGTIVRVEAIKDAGGFDARFVAGEDIDLFIRMMNRGWKALHAKEALLFYWVRPSWRAVFHQSIWWSYGRYLLSIKHPKIVSNPLFTKTLDRKRRIPNYLIDLFNVTIKSIKSVEIFRTPEVLLIPLYFIYRRIGYLWGYLLATKYIKLENHVKEW